jgi:hypothetical protein
VGLPLLEGLPEAELLAVLAHECAHLSKGHHRMGQWVYRLRRSWEQEFQTLSRPRRAGEVSLRPVYRKFVDWFWPRFNAYAFVLSRTHEYEADALAAALAGAPAAAAALMRIAWHQRVLEQKFWPELWQGAAASPSPPDGVFLRLSKALGSLDRSDVQWLEQAFRSTTTNADTHPCLADRLRGVGWVAVQGNGDPLSGLPPARPTAAEVLLGSALASIRTDVEALWRGKAEPAWRQQHGKAGLLEAQLEQLDKSVVAKQADTDALCDKARMLLELRQKEAAIPLLRQVLALDSGHVAASFNLGRLLLDGGNSEGELHLERAITANPELLPQAAGSFHAYYRLTGQPERLRELSVRLDRHEKSLAASRLERSQISAADPLIPHGLSPTDLDALRLAIEAEPDVIEAHLGRKELRHFIEQKLYLLCIRLRPAWHRLPKPDKEQLAIQRLVKTVRLPGRVFIFAPSGSFRRLGRNLARLPGSCLFSRR